MKKFRLHKKQIEFLKNYLKYYITSCLISSMAHERVIDIVATGIYCENDRELLNKIRKACRSLVMKDGNGLFTPIKGKQHIKPGIVWSPYIPMVSTTLTYNPNNFKPKKGVMQRYADKVVNTKYYGNIKIDTK
jgi:hypothetical protein